MWCLFSSVTPAKLLIGSLNSSHTELVTRLTRGKAKHTREIVSLRRPCVCFTFCCKPIPRPMKCITLGVTYTSSDALCDRSCSRRVCSQGSRTKAGSHAASGVEHGGQETAVGERCHHGRRQRRRGKSLRPGGRTVSDGHMNLHALHPAKSHDRFQRLACYRDDCGCR